MKTIKVREWHDTEFGCYYYTTFFTNWRKAKAYLRNVERRGWAGRIVRGSSGTD